MSKKDIVIKNTAGIPITYSQVDGIVCKDTSGKDADFTEGVALELQEKTLTVTENGSQVINPDTGYDALTKVNLTVNVSGGGGTYQAKTNIDPTTSSQTIIPDTGFDALSSVQINAIPSQYKDTTGTDVVAANILSGKKAVNTTGIITGTMTDNGATGTTITNQGGTYTIPTGYTSGGTVKAQLPITTLDNTIISGQAFEESTGDYGWKSTVTIPTGNHESQTLEKTFSDIFPAPETEGTADKMLLGYQLYDHKGKVITGTMSNNDATTGTISTQGGTFTIPEGYHNGKGKITATLPSGSTGTPTAVKGTVSNNSVSVTPSVTSSTGYITGSTVSGSPVTVSASELVSGNINLTNTNSTDVSNYATAQIVDANLVADNIAEDVVVLGITGTHRGGSGTYQAKSNINPTTSSQTITPDSGYDDLSSVQINAMPTGSATTPATTITQNPTVTKSGGNIIASYSKSQSVTPTVNAGYVSTGTAGTISTSGSTTIAATSLEANLTAGNIKKDVSIFGVTGTMEGGIDTSDATATASDILSGKTAYAKGSKITGTMAIYDGSYTVG